MSVRNQPRDIRYPLGVVGLILAAFVLRVGLQSLISTLTGGSVSWIPMFGTIGETVTIYSLAVTLFTLVLVPVAAFWLGKRYGQKSV